MHVLFPHLVHADRREALVRVPEANEEHVLLQGHEALPDEVQRHLVLRVLDAVLQAHHPAVSQPVLAEPVALVELVAFAASERECVC